MLSHSGLKLLKTSFFLYLLNVFDFNTEFVQYNVKKTIYNRYHAVFSMIQLLFNKTAPAIFYVIEAIFHVKLFLQNWTIYGCDTGIFSLLQTPQIITALLPAGFIIENTVLFNVAFVIQKCISQLSFPVDKTKQPRPASPWALVS